MTFPENPDQNTENTESIWETYDWDQPFDLETFPLDDPGMFDLSDWGGDGSDPIRPVRAHVLEALVLTDEPYPPPVSDLLQLGDPREPEADAARQELGLTREHAPDLVRMARDRALNTALGDTDEVWAPIHALKALAELDTSAVVSDLLPLLDVQSDWYHRVLDQAIAQAGAVALEPLQRYLTDDSRWTYGRTSAADALAAVAKTHPDLRDQVVQILSDELQRIEQNHEIVNTFVSGALAEIQAVEALPLIRRAYELERVDEMVYGGWAEMLKEFGMKPDPDDPLVESSARRFEERHDQLIPRDIREQFAALLEQQELAQSAPPPSPPPVAPAPPVQPLPPTPAALPQPTGSSQQKARKEKNKRKQSSAARKTNKRKKKR